ncbi:hypothetical protein LSCM1_02383 [Leishmania martiniquensis]|uniref:Uncharacterized protein n=1 Tax=Leishmania martiniquensis TaxID=1580590 RepID=A0A836H1S4_9TRYP|nr:hypothetical protein LSCM1_02383 [Leishmania martiniquensis]
MRAQQRRLRLALTCACLTFLMSLLLTSSPTLVTALDELVRDVVMPFPEGAHQGELEVDVPAPVAEHVDSVDLSEWPREAIVEVSVEIPLDGVAEPERGTLDTQQAYADVATSVAEAQRVIEAARVAEENRKADEPQRVMQVEREEGSLEAKEGRRAEWAVQAEDSGREENEHLAAGAQITAVEAPERRGVDAERLSGAPRSEEVSPLAVRPPAEEADAQPSRNGSLHPANGAQDAATYHSGQSPPPFKLVQEDDLSSSEAAVTRTTNPATDEEVGIRTVGGAQEAEEVQVTPETQQVEKAHDLEEMYKVAEEARRLQEAQAAQELRREERAHDTQEAARQAEDAQQAEGFHEARETRLEQETQRAEETRLAEEEAQGAEVTRRAEEKLQADVAAEKAVPLRKTATEAQGRLSAQRKEVLVKIGQEKVRFQAAFADLAAQQEETSATQRNKAVASELQRFLGERLDTLHRDLATLGRISVTLRGMVTSLLRGDRPLAQVREDVQALDEKIAKAGETLENIREATTLLTRTARAAVETQEGDSAASSETSTLFAEQKRALISAHNAVIQPLVALLQTLDTQLAQVAKQLETQGAEVAEPTKAAESAAAVSSVGPATTETAQEVASLLSGTPQPVEETPTLTPPLSAAQAEVLGSSPKHAEERHARYSGEPAEDLAKHLMEKGYSKGGRDAHRDEDGVPYMVKGHMQIIGTVVVITIAATVQTLRWCHNGCLDGEEGEESDGTVEAGRQAKEMLSLSPQNAIPGSGGPSPQRPQASLPPTSPPRGVNTRPHGGDGESPSCLESGKMLPPSQCGTPSAASEHMRLLGKKGHTLSPTPVARNHAASFRPGAPATCGSEVIQGPSYGGSPLDAARAPPPPLGPKSPFMPHRNAAPGIYPSPMHQQLPLTGGQFDGPSPLQLPGRLPMAGATPQMHRRRNNSDDFELHNPFLSRWS